MITLHYYRAEKNRVDSVVLMLPDLAASSHSLMPSPEAYAQMEERVKAQLAAKVAAIDAEEFVLPPSTENINSNESKSNSTASVSAAATTTTEQQSTGTTERQQTSNGDVPAAVVEGDSAQPTAAAAVASGVKTTSGSQNTEVQ